MIVHVIDGTYELFRYFMSPAAAFDRDRAARQPCLVDRPLADLGEVDLRPVFVISPGPS